MAHQVNITGQITPVKAVCDMARAKGIETIVDGAHSFAQFDFQQKDLGCDYFGTSLYKVPLRSQGHGFALREAIQNRKDLAVDGSGSEAGGRHSQV